MGGHRVQAVHDRPAGDARNNPEGRGSRTPVPNVPVSDNRRPVLTRLDELPFPAWDLEVAEQVPIVAPPEAHRAEYLATKKEKLGHNIPQSAITGEGDSQDNASVESARHSLQPDR